MLKTCETANQLLMLEFYQADVSSAPIVWLYCIFICVLAGQSAFFSDI